MSPQNSLYTTISLLADRLCLGSHWVYDQAQLAEAFPEGVRQFSNPLSKYHPNRIAGQMTHYGDQTQFLSKCIVDHSQYSLEAWKAHWSSFMKGYDGYIDGASKTTLGNQMESPSDSDDLAGAARIGPILDLGLSLQETIRHARSQTEMTHGDPVVADVAEFICRAVDALQSGASFTIAFEKAATEGAYQELPVSDYLLKVNGALGEDYLSVSRDMGLTCSVEDAFPLLVYFALSHEKEKLDLLDSLSRNALAGGDTSARGILLAILVVASSPESLEADELKRLLV